MSKVKASVIIPTHNRQDGLVETLAGLRRQQLEETDYEIIVVDDGSSPPVEIGERMGGPTIRVERTEGVERSAARNHGAALAHGDLLIFLDDDMSINSDFVAAHLRAQAEWPGALVVGSVKLPEEAMVKPFARFRQRLERRGLPPGRGPTETGNFCTASNMSISRNVLRDLGGFEATIISGEDQDLALRYKAQGGRIVFVPEAEAIHRDDALDIRSYCSRTRWGSLAMIPFCQRYSALPDNVDRDRVNGPMRFGREPLLLSVRKLGKQILAAKAFVAIGFAIASVLERLAPNGRSLDRIYRLLLGVHIFRGYRQGLRAVSDRQSAAIRERVAGTCLKANR